MQHAARLLLIADTIQNMTKKIISIIPILLGIAFCAFAKPKPDLQYQLKYTNNRMVHVTLIYTPPEKDSTTFTYGEPNFGGQWDILKCIANVEVLGPARLRTDKASRSFTIFYSGEKPVKLEYDIVDTTTKKKDLRQELFRPIISNNYFYSHGINLFLNPQFKNKDLKPTMSIEWLQRPNFPIFYGFDPENGGKKKLISTVDSVMFSLITGATDLSIDKFELHGVKNYIVLRGLSKDNFNRQAIRNYFTQFNESIRSFWNDYSDKCFSLVLQPFLESDHDVAGVAFANGFIGKYTADTILNAKRIYTISHEIGHHWIGHKLEMNISNQWFDEGFNDYITFNALLRAGLLTPTAFENRMNEVFTLHYSSAIRNTPNDSVFANYWKMGDYNKLPYRRGCIFAFYLDNQIRLASRGQKTIRDLLRSLAEFRKGKPAKYEITVEDFIKVTSALLPKAAVESAIEDYIIKGNPIIFSNDMLIPEFKVSVEKGIPHIKIVDEKKFRLAFYSIHD